MGGRTRIITIACAKGGAAKTTTAMLLAGSLAKRGLTVAVLDADNTGGATKWAETVEDAAFEAEAGGRTARRLPFAVTPINQALLDRRRVDARHPGAWVIIDTPPSDTGTIQKAIDIGDVTVIPTQTGAADLTLAGETYAACARAIVLLTRVKRRTRSARQAVEDLDSAGITRFDTLIPEREAIRAAYGTAVTDVAYAEAATELVDFMRGLERATEGE